jgi:hypothetical protein
VVYRRLRITPCGVINPRAFPVQGMALGLCSGFYARLEWEIIAPLFLYYLVYLVGVLCAHVG